MEQVGGSRRLIFSFPSSSAAVPMKTMKNDRPSRKLSTGFLLTESVLCYMRHGSTGPRTPRDVSKRNFSFFFEVLRHAIGEVK